jgi:hypothetical protein
MSVIQVPEVGNVKKYTYPIFTVAPCINNIKLFIVQLMHTNYITLLNYYNNYNDKSCSNMFRFT